MACPQVVGTAALVRSQNPDATPDQVRQHIQRTAKDLASQEYRGEGHLSTLRAVLEPIITD